MSDPLWTRAKRWGLAGALAGTAGTAGYYYLLSKGIIDPIKKDQIVPDPVPLTEIIPFQEAPWDDPLLDENGELVQTYHKYLL